MANINTVDDLVKSFVNDEPYSIRKEWIENVFNLLGLNIMKTFEELLHDRDVRECLQGLYVMRNSGNNTTKKNAEIENLIDALVRGRNLNPYLLRDIDLRFLHFDLHWFTESQAVKFVREIRWALELDPRRFNEDINVYLITGCGKTNGEWLARIHDALLEQFFGHITQTPEYGVLQLLIPKISKYPLLTMETKNIPLYY